MLRVCVLATEIELQEAECWYLFVDTYVNGRYEKYPWNIGIKDEFQVRISSSLEQFILLSLSPAICFLPLLRLLPKILDVPSCLSIS